MKLQPTDKVVASVGDSMICLIPERIDTVRYSEKFIRKPAGAEINTLIGLSRLGVNTRFLSEFSTDEFGRFMEHYLHGEKIQTRTCKTSRPTPIFIKQILRDGSIKANYYRNRTAGSEMKNLPDFENFDREIDLFFFSGIFPALSPENDRTLYRSVESLKKSQVFTVFDPNIRFKLFEQSSDIPEFMLRYIRLCDLLLIGDKEGSFIFGKEEPDEIYAEAQKSGVKHLVIKRGESGSIIYESGEKYVVPAIAPKFLLDTCGAGDAYNAGYLYGLLSGLPAKERGKIASLVAGQVLQSYSDNENLPYIEELEALLNAEENTGIGESDR